MEFDFDADWRFNGLSYTTEGEISMRCILIVAMTVTIYCSAFGQSKDRSDKQGGNVEEAVMRIEREMLDALLKGDSSANERYLADSYVFTGPDGLVIGRTQGIADLKSGDLKFQSQRERPWVCENSRPERAENSRLQMMGDGA